MYYQLIEEFTPRNIIKAEIVDDGYPYLYLTTSKDLYLLRATDMNILFNKKNTDVFRIYKQKEGGSNLKDFLVLKDSDKDKEFRAMQKKQKDRLMAGCHYSIKDIYGNVYPDVIFLGSNLYTGYKHNASYSHIVLDGYNGNFHKFKNLYFYDRNKKEVFYINYRKNLEEIIKLSNEKIDIDLETLKEFCKKSDFILLPGNFKA